MSIETRRAGEADLKFVDSLQAKFSHQLGYLPLEALRLRCSAGDVILATENGEPAGYLLGYNRYQQRDHLGIITQAAIDYSAQRCGAGAALVVHWVRELPPAVDQLALWCAQDIDANLFWDAMGFHALAYRAGSFRKQRIHIYWSRHVGDVVEDAPLWVPGGTKAGLLKGPRDVRLLEPGQDWRDRIKLDWGKIEAGVKEVQAAAVARKAAKPRKAAAPVELPHALQHATFSGVPDGFIRIVRGGVAKLIPAPKL